MPPPRRRVARLLDTVLKLRPGELRPLVVLFFWCFCQVGGVWAGRTVRDSLFLAHAKAHLPYMYIATPLSVSAMGYAYARFADRFRRDRLVLGTALLIGTFYLVARVITGTGAGWFYYVLYVLVDVFTAVCGMQLWTVVADRYNTRDAKRLFGLVAAGGTLANVVVGGLVASTVERVGAENLLFVSAGLFYGTGALAWLLRRMSGGQLGRTRQRPASKGPAPDPRGVPGAGHLRLVAFIVVTAVLTVTALDFQYKTITAEHFGGDKVLMMRFFGKLSIVTGLVAMGIQFGVTSRLLNKIGVAGTLLILPGFLSLGALSLLIVPGLAAAAFCKGSDQAFRYTLNDAGMQLLYLPVPSQLRSRAKATLDAFVRPTTEMLVGVGTLIYRAFASSLLPIAGAALVFAAAWVTNIIRLRGAYVKSLREILRRRRLDLSGEAARPALDAAAAVRKALTSGDQVEVLNAMELARELGAGLDDEVAALLEHPNARVRAQACAYLGGREGFVAPLRARLDDSDAGVRAAAAAAYCRVAGAEAIDAVRPLLDAREAAVRAAAVAGIHRAGGDVAAAMAALTNAPDPADRIFGADTAGEIGDAESLAALIADPNAGVAQAAIAAAARLKAVALQAPLAEALGRRGHGRAAAAALAAYGPGIESFVGALLADREVPAAARRQLPRVLAALATPEAVALLVEELQTVDDKLRDAACRALAQARRKNPALAIPRERIVAACDAELVRAYTALAAAEGLGRAETTANPDGTHSAPDFAPDRPEGAASLISKTLRERADAAGERLFALLDVLHPEAELDVVRANLVDADPARRANAVELLDSILDKRLRRLLVPLIDDSPRYAKVKAVEGVLEVPKKTRDAWVRSLLADDNAWMVACAAYYAGMHDVLVLTAEVTALRGHASPVVRETAEAALVRLRSPQAR